MAGLKNHIPPELILTSEQLNLFSKNLCLSVEGEFLVYFLNPPSPEIHAMRLSLRHKLPTERVLSGIYIVRTTFYFYQAEAEFEVCFAVLIRLT